MTTTIVDELIQMIRDYGHGGAESGDLRAIESRLRELLTGEPVAWRAVAQPSIHDFLNSDERDVVYFDAREVPTGEDAKGFTITPLYRSPRPFDAASISDERIDAAVDEWFASDAKQAYGPVFTPELKDAAFRNRMRAAIAALVQP